MYLINMRPSQIKDAVQRNVPVIMAAGVIEYHGPHLPVGTDLIVPAKIIEEVEKRCECIVAPHFPFGATNSWAGGPEEGEIDFPSQPLYTYAKEVFKGLLNIGFRRIYVMHYHQGGGEQELGLKLAARSMSSS